MEKDEKTDRENEEKWDATPTPTTNHKMLALLKAQHSTAHGTYNECCYYFRIPLSLKYKYCWNYAVCYYIALYWCCYVITTKNQSEVSECLAIYILYFHSFCSVFSHNIRWKLSLFRQITKSNQRSYVFALKICFVSFCMSIEWHWIVPIKIAILNLAPLLIHFITSTAKIFSSFEFFFYSLRKYIKMLKYSRVEKRIGQKKPLHFDRKWIIGGKMSFHTLKRRTHSFGLHNSETDEKG